MLWMMRWAGGFPVFAAEADGARIVDVDGHAYVDLCLGDTGAMPGHGPPAVVQAVRAQLGRGITTMLPTEDAIWVGEELSRRFGLARWLFTLTATDANRTAAAAGAGDHGRPLRASVLATATRLRRRVVRRRGRGRHDPRARGQRRPGGQPRPASARSSSTTLRALEAALADGLVACVLAEPAMTNMGIVHPRSRATTSACATHARGTARC